MIRAAIVGLGTWGRNLVASVQGRSESIQFVAGATRTPAKAAGFAAQQGIRMADAYEALLADPGVDAVVLATPHSLHEAEIVAAAHAGKHVFVEKPLGLDHADARRAVAACNEAGVTLAVGYNWRFQPALREIRRLFDTGSLGKLLHLEGNFCGPSAYRFGREHWRHDPGEVPAGGMTGRGVHVVDAMLYLAGRIESVAAQSHRLAQDFGVDDTTSMLFRFRERRHRLPRHGHRHRGDLAPAGVRHEGLGRGGRRRAPHDVAAARVPARSRRHHEQAASGDRRVPDDQHRARRARAFRAGGSRAAGRSRVADGDEVHNVAVLEAIVASATQGTRVVVAD